MEKSCLQREALDWGCMEVGEWAVRAGGRYVRLRAHQKEGLSPWLHQGAVEPMAVERAGTQVGSSSDKMNH